MRSDRAGALETFLPRLYFFQSPFWILSIPFEDIARNLIFLCVPSLYLNYGVMESVRRS